MRWLDTIRLRFRSVVHRTRADQDLDTEIRFHLDQEVQQHRARGVSPAEATRRARLAFGPLDAVKHDCRASWGFRVVESLVRDVRHGLRGLRRGPGFTTMVMLTLGVGIGATTLLFAVAWALWLRPLPYPGAERLVVIEELPPRRPPSVWNPTFSFWRDEATVLDRIAATATSLNEVNLAGRGEPERVASLAVSPGFFPMLSTEPFAVGRGFVAADEEPDAADVAVLSHGFWTRRFGGERSVVGETLRLDDRPVVVVGVAPASFRPPVSSRVDVYRPLAFPPLASVDFPRIIVIGLRVIGRLAAGVSLDRAVAELEVLRARTAAALYPDAFTTGAAAMLTRDPLRVQSLHEHAVGDVPGRVWLLSGAIALLLIIACANVANLQVIRTLGRQRELMVRLAMGATRRRVAAQLLTETLVLGVLAAGAALAALAWGTGVLRAWVSDAAWLADTIRLDGVTLGFTAGIVLLLCLVSAGAALAWTPRLPSWTTTGLQSGAPGPRRRLQSVLLSGQVALTLVLLVSAGLLMTSLLRLTAADLGFERRQLMTFRAAPPRGDLREQSERVRFAGRIVERVAALPGVESVAMITRPPLEPASFRSLAGVDGRDIPEDRQPLVAADTVSPGLFATLGVRVEAGRDFTPRDGPEAALVVIANRQFVRRFFPGESDTRILDRPRLKMPRGPGSEDVSIVGIVADAQTISITDEVAPHLFLPNTQVAVYEPAFLVRATSDPTALVPAIRAEILDIDPDLPLYDVATVDDRVAQVVGPERMSSVLAGAFAALALLLAAVGVYSTAAHVAAQRRYELGVRLALGATARQLVTLVVGKTIRPVLIGVLLGIGATLASGSLLGNFLFEIGPTDPGSLGAAVVLLLGIALLASYLPARRVSRVDPVVTLKSE